jgi:cytochrome c oxidase assembly protein subunit 17
MGDVREMDSRGSFEHQERTQVASPVEEANTKKKKICCACPETKRARDECIAERGEEACRDLIEAHKACLRAEGFQVPP